MKAPWIKIYVFDKFLHYPKGPILGQDDDAYTSKTLLNAEGWYGLWVVKGLESILSLMNIHFRFDIYRKVPKDLTQPTVAGAVVSICSVLFIVFLMMSELSSFIQTEM